MNILWIYDKPLIPEAGGTERITSIISLGLSNLGHNCLGILQFSEDSDIIVYNNNRVDNLTEFLIKNAVEVVINQIAYTNWLLDKFLSSGGEQWHRNGGKIISCLHFDPQNPSFIQLLRSYETLSCKQYFTLIKHLLFKKFYIRQQRHKEGETYNYIYDNSDTFVTLSESHFPYMQKVMRRNEYSKLSAIGNPLTFPYIENSSIIETKEKIVVVCARMSEFHKRISIILQAWKMIKRSNSSFDWKLIIIGDGPDLPRYKNIVKNQKIHDIKFLGQQSPEEYYKKASILLLTSSAEGWGLTITEGLQNGVVPVVMDSSSVYHDIIRSNYNGILIPNNNISAFANAVTLLMADRDCLTTMQLNALESAKHFTLEKAMKKWKKLLLTNFD